MMSNPLLQYLPDRHDEAWKYTKCDVLTKHDFKLATSTDFVEIDGVPEGVLVLPLAEAFIQHEDKTKPYFGQVMQATHGFHRFNDELFQSGLFIYVPEGVQVTEPLTLKHTKLGINEMHVLRHLVVAERDSMLNLVETYREVSDAPAFTNVVTEIMLMSEAKVTHTKLIESGKQAFHVGDVFVRQKQNSHFESHSLFLSGQWVRSDTTVKLEEKGAHCLMNGIYLPSDDEHIDHHTKVEHAVAACTSSQDYKGIISDKARAVFNGKVVVLEGAMQTEAKQYNKNVLLSKDAEIDTKPELQIFADDVVCAHGATVGQLDEEALFYLASRGIDAELAHKYLIQAFLADNISYLKALDVGEAIEKCLMEHME